MNAPECNALQPGADVNGAPSEPPPVAWRFKPWPQSNWTLSLSDPNKWMEYTPHEIRPLIDAPPSDAAPVAGAFMPSVARLKTALEAMREVDSCQDKPATIYCDHCFDNMTYAFFARLALAHPEDAPEGKATCTGVSAAWCPIHGDCICVREGTAGFDDPDCPLHSSESRRTGRGYSALALYPFGGW